MHNYAQQHTRTEMPAADASQHFADLMDFIRIKTQREAFNDRLDATVFHDGVGLPGFLA